MARGYNGSAANYHLGTAAPLGRYPATLIGRYKKSSDVTTEQCMSSIGVSGGATKLICVEILSGGILALAGDGTTFTGATKAGALADSAWHSFCGVFRDHQWRIAGHDGVFGTAETTTRDWLNLAPTMNRVTVGALFWSPTTAINPFNGELAECAFLQTALSEAEFLAWHNGTHGGRAYTIQDMRPGTCRAYYPLNDGVGNEANYCSKYANLNYDLTEQGTVTQTTHPTVAAFVPDGMFRPLLSNQRVWSDGSSERILAGAHTWPGIVQHMYLTRQSVSDTFDRSGGVAASLGSNWTNEINANQIATNDTAEPISLNVEAVSRWTGSYVTGSDQFAVIAEAGLSGAGASVMGPVVRCDAAALNMYYVAAPPNGTMTLFKRVAGVSTSLGTFAHVFAANKQLYLEAIGTAIKVYVDGVLRISATDSSVTSGLPGFRMYHATGDGCQMEWFRGGNLAESTFLSDAFTDTAGVALTAHTSVTGITWTLAPSQGGSYLVTDANRIRPNVDPTGGSGPPSCWHYASSIPSSPDYDVEMVVRYFTNATGAAGVIGRASTTVNTAYHAYIYSDGLLRLEKGVAGVFTQLGSYTPSPVFSAGNDYTVRLSMVGTAIKVYLDGVLRISVTDSSITATGRAGVGGQGLYTNTTGIHIDSITAIFAPSLASFSFYGQNYTTYLDTLASYGHNYVRLWGWDFMRSPVFSDDTLNEPLPFARSSTPGAYDGGNKFDLTTLDSTYFTRLVDFVAAARTRGIICSVALWEMSLAKTLTAGHPFTSTNNINLITGESGGTMSPVYTLNIAAVTTAQLLYLRHVLDLLGGYWNVQYELGNEPFAGTTNSNGTTSGCAAWQDAMSKEIREYEFANCTFQHMVVANSAGSGANDQLEVSASRAPDASQVGDGWVGYSGTPNFTVPEAPAQSLILDSDHVSNNVATFSSDVFMRAVCQGHSGVLYMEDGFNFSAGTAVIKPAIRSNLRLILQLTRRMTLALARPSSALASTGFCLAYPGFEYLAYQNAAAASFTVDLSSAPGKRFNVEWYNTNDDTQYVNRVIAGQVIGGSATQKFVQPFGGVAGVVLYLTAAPSASRSRVQATLGG